GKCCEPSRLTDFESVWTITCRPMIAIAGEPAHRTANLQPHAGAIVDRNQLVRPVRRPIVRALIYRSSQMAQTDTGYGTVAKLLHWLIFVLVAVQYAIGSIMPHIGRKTLNE